MDMYEELGVRIPIGTYIVLFQKTLFMRFKNEVPRQCWVDLLFVTRLKMFENTGEARIENVVVRTR